MVKLFSRIWQGFVSLWSLLFGRKPEPVGPGGIGQWMEVNRNAPISKRHEACFVMVKQFAYLMGGRGRKNVDVYNPLSGTWSQKTGPPLELHHMQCVAVPDDDQIYIVSAWTGGYPMERNTEFIYVRMNKSRQQYFFVLRL
jgi:hypothetical protein